MVNTFQSCTAIISPAKIQLFTVFQLTTAARLVITECQKIQGGIVYSGLMHLNCTFSVYFYSLRRNAKAKSAVEVNWNTVKSCIFGRGNNSGAALKSINQAWLWKSINSFVKPAMYQVLDRVR